MGLTLFLKYVKIGNQQREKEKRKIGLTSFSLKRLRITNPGSRAAFCGSLRGKNLARS